MLWRGAAASPRPWPCSTLETCARFVSQFPARSSAHDELYGLNIVQFVSLTMLKQQFVATVHVTYSTSRLFSCCGQLYAGNNNKGCCFNNCISHMLGSRLVPPVCCLNAALPESPVCSDNHCCWCCCCVAMLQLLECQQGAHRRCKTRVG